MLWCCDVVGDSSVLWARKMAQKVIFQILNFPRVPESRVVGEHFGLLFGSGTRDLAEIWRTKTRMSWISSLVSLYRIFPRDFSCRVPVARVLGCLSAYFTAFLGHPGAAVALVVGSNVEISSIGAIPVPAA